MTMNKKLQLLMADAQKPPRHGRGNPGDIIELPRMLDTIDEFIEVAKAAIDDMRLDDDYLADCRRRGCRTHLEVWRPHAIGYVGHVTNGRWWSIVQNQIKGMINDLQIRQYNGDWRLADADFQTFFMDVVEERATDAAVRRFSEDFTTTVKKTKTRFFLLAVEFVDVKGADAAQFRSSDGMPADADELPSTISPDIRALLEMAQAADILRQQQQQPETDASSEQMTALQQRNDELAQELGSVREMLEKLMAAQMAAATAAPAPAPEPAPAKPRRSRRKRPTIDAQLEKLEGGEQ